MHPIQLRGARLHNLASVDLELSPGTLVVLTGPSGAGKSSLACGTLYAEGQRRCVESFSPYARQFLERLARPPVQRLQPVPAAVAVDRRLPVKTSRSTVATMTELSEWLRQLWAHSASVCCPTCGSAVAPVTPAIAAERVLRDCSDARLVITHEVGLEGPEHYLGVREGLVRSGYRRVLIEGQTRDLDTVAPSEALAAGAGTGGAAALAVIVDRTTARPGQRSRLRAAFEEAFERGKGRAAVWVQGASPLMLSTGLRCDACGHSQRKPTPGLFSYNSPLGACPTCRGFGRTVDVDWARVLDGRRTLADGAVRPFTGKSRERERRALLRFCAQDGVPTDVPVSELSPEQRQALLDGTGGGWRAGWPGLRAWFKWLETKAYKMHVRVLLSRYRAYVPCASCKGSRFKPEVQAYRVADHSLPQFMGLEVGAALALLQGLSDSLSRDPAGTRVLKACLARLQVLRDVGLSYLTLDRSTRSLSGGELQRVSLSSALGAALTATLFVLDEPTAGLHPSDVESLFQVVRRLSRGDNIALVVESDPRFMSGADRIVELGPGSGEAGGRVVFDGTPAQLSSAQTRTSRALSAMVGPARQARGQEHWLELIGARGHNLRDATLRIPVGRLSCVTGPSGAGKSSLVLQTFARAVQQGLLEEADAPLAHDELRGLAHVNSVVVVDQSALGRTSRGNPATYLGVWDAIRKRLAKTELAVERDYKPGVFSFNVAGGRCEECKGEGAETVEMQFLADVRFSCPHCGGRRFVGPVLDVKLEGMSVAELLELTARAARERLAPYPEVGRALEPLLALGLDYLRLGQPLNTLSGGEAQRLRLARAMVGAKAGSLLVLDEPTAGLHAGDLPALLSALADLTDRGCTVVVVEHEMRVAAQADWVVDLGPGAGQAGGSVVASGTPTQVAASNARSAPYLAKVLRARGPAKRRGGGKEARAPRAADAPDAFQVRGAREHNLKNIDVDIPKGGLTVVTGPSGSGKSTLAFDVVFAEAQRRYLETLSPYVRQYLRQLPRPAVDRVDGTPPAVSLEQSSTSGARNSTVGTVTEVAHYLRVAFARAGSLHCPRCQELIAARSPQAITSDLQTRFGRRKLKLFAPTVRSRKGSHRDLLERARQAGHTHALIDGQLLELQPGMKLDRYKEHDVELLVSELSAASAGLQASVEKALSLGGGALIVRTGSHELSLSSTRACPRCGEGFPELDPRFFSFNTRQGACPQCEGAGVVEQGRARGNAPPVLRHCDACDGQRLSGLALHTTLAGVRFTELLDLSVDSALERFERLEAELAGRQRAVAAAPLKQARLRLSFLQRVGLGYLSLGRAALTLSGGELQRVRLAAQLGSGLTGLLYVLDEPTIGLHPRDTQRLLGALRELVDQGCSVLVVEHDADTILAADQVIDVGPVGGAQGGRVVAQGTPTQLLADPESVTGRALSAPLSLRPRRPVGDVPWLALKGAEQHNLQGVELRVPLGRLVAVTGVSGSGKSTLVREVLLRAVRQQLGLVGEPPGRFTRLEGAEALDRAVEIDQSPIGRTPRSVPATYVGLWDEIRKLYAATAEARARGYGPSRFSFNVKKGRCPDCEGQGATQVEMAFLPQALVHCESCDGQRFNAETREVRLHGLHAGELLDMEVADAERLLHAVPKVVRPLRLLSRLGLDYLKLGQPSNTLSGGEAQRLKLVSELSAAGRSKTLYVMDEPTTGLHRSDVEKLLQVIDELVERGDSVVVIEHQPDVIAAADWVVDLGPEGGAAGGRIVAQGTPEQIMQTPQSHTGRALRAALPA